MNPMRIMKMVGQRLAGSWNRWLETEAAARWTVAVLSLGSALVVAAQEPDAAGQTNELTDAEVLARLGELIQAADSGQAGEMVLPNDSSATNGVPQANGPPSAADHVNRFSRFDGTNRVQSSSRSQNDDRRSRGRRSFRSRSDQNRSSGSASEYGRSDDRPRVDSSLGTNNGPASLDYSAFSVIVDRNIFDPNRYPHQPGRGGARPAPRSVDSLTLVGTMSYEKGTFAFFDGSSSDYKKALRLNDVIAGYKVTNIAPTGVKLATSTNELNLAVGMQLRREEDGPWQLLSQPSSYATTADLTATNTATAAVNTDSASGAAESDVIKRMMQRREKE